MLTGRAAQQRRRPGPQQTMGGRGRGARGGAMAARGRGGQVPRAAMPQQPAPPASTQNANARSGAQSGAAPSISQVTMVQAQNLNTLRELVEDLAKGVVELSKVVGDHTTKLDDIKGRIESVEAELGAEIDYSDEMYEQADTNDEQHGETNDNADDEPELGDNAEEAA